MRMGLSSTRNQMVSEANRYEKREAENHRLESQKHAANAEKLGFQHTLLMSRLLRLEHHLLQPHRGTAAHHTRNVQRLGLLNAQLLNDAAALCSTENKRVFIQTKLIYTPAAQRISEWGKRKKERNSVTAGAAGARETCENIRNT